MKREASGITGRPMRLVRFWSVNAYDIVSWSGGMSRRAGPTYPRVVVFALHVQKALVQHWSGVVELGDVGMFEPVDDHLGSDHDEEWAHDFSRPLGEEGETFREDPAGGGRRK